MSTVKNKSLSERLKDLLRDDKQRQAAKLIEAAARSIFGDETNFIYRAEAEKIAELNYGELSIFAKEVDGIKCKLDKEYAEAASLLGDDNENT